MGNTIYIMGRETWVQSSGCPSGNKMFESAVSARLLPNSGSAITSAQMANFDLYILSRKATSYENTQIPKAARLRVLKFNCRLTIWQEQQTRAHMINHMLNLIARLRECFVKEIDTSLCTAPVSFIGGLAKLVLTSLIKHVTGDLTASSLVAQGPYALVDMGWGGVGGGGQFYWDSVDRWGGLVSVSFETTIHMHSILGFHSPRDRGQTYGIPPVRRCAPEAPGFAYSPGLLPVGSPAPGHGSPRRDWRSWFLPTGGPSLAPLQKTRTAAAHGACRIPRGHCWPPSRATCGSPCATGNACAWLVLGCPGDQGPADRQPFWDRAALWGARHLAIRRCTTRQPAEAPFKNSQGTTSLANTTCIILVKPCWIHRTQSTLTTESRLRHS